MKYLFYFFLIILQSYFLHSPSYSQDEPINEEDLTNYQCIALGNDYNQLLKQQNTYFNSIIENETKLFEIRDEKSRTLVTLGGITQLKNHIESLTKEVNLLKSIENINEAQNNQLNIKESRLNALILAQKTIKNYDDDIQQITKNHINSKFCLREVESKIAVMLNKDNREFTFRVWVSLAFCAIVLILVLVFNNSISRGNIHKEVFSGEKGIQFIALFLIIVAIILFGLMNILESKELSALLGGLSGYILGRASNADNNNTDESQISNGSNNISELPEPTDELNQ